MSELVGNSSIHEVINRLKGKGGEEYQGSGSAEHKSRRNPVKEDTFRILTATSFLWQPRRVFEMGTAYGLSACLIGLGSPQSEIITVEFDPEVAQQAQMNLDEAGLNVSVLAKSVAEIDDLPALDYVFIDHDKGSYLPDFQHIEQFLASGALVLADNVIDRARETAPFREYVEAKYETQLLETQAGLLMVRI